MDIAALPATASLASTALRPVSDSGRNDGRHADAAARQHAARPAIASPAPTPSSSDTPRFPRVLRSVPSESTAAPARESATGFRARQASSLYSAIEGLDGGSSGELLNRVDVRA